MIVRKQHDGILEAAPTTARPWHELAIISHYQTAVAVKQALHQGKFREAAVGMQELIDALARPDKRALKSQLIRLMAHVITWQTQPAKRSRGWRATINSARREIHDIQEETPSLTGDVIEAMWQACFQAAREEAEADMNQETIASLLTWEDVFEREYQLETPRRRPRRRQRRRSQGR